MPPFIRTKAFLRRRIARLELPWASQLFMSLSYISSQNVTKKNSCFCKTVNDWNTLLSEIVSIKSADRFKKVLNEQLSPYT